MKKNGFTIVELLGVVIILGIITAITIPSVNVAVKRFREGAYEALISSIENATKDWTVDYITYLPNEEGESITITLGQLVQGNYIDKNIKDPKSGEYVSPSTLITISKVKEAYLYDIGLVGGGKHPFDSFPGQSPTIILEGYASNNVEVNTTFVDPGIIVTNGNLIDGKTYEKTIYKINNENKEEVEEIDESIVGTVYEIVYKASNENGNVEMTRTVKIVDTKAPVLTFTSNSGVVKESDTYYIKINAGDEMVIPGVVIKDNSCGTSGVDTNVNSCNTTLTIDHTEGLYNTLIPDTYDYVYYAKDSSGNLGSLALEIRVVDEETPEIASITSNTTDWTTSNLVLTVNASDNVGVTKYSFDNGSTWQTSNSKTFNTITAGNITVKVKDDEGNTASKTVSIESRTEYGYQDVSTWSSSYSTTQPSDGYYTSKTQYGYQDVSTWSTSYSTTQPSDGYYKSKTQYNLSYTNTTYTSKTGNFYDMTGNSSPSPFTASAVGWAEGTAYYAFDNNTDTVMYSNNPNGDTQNQPAEPYVKLMFGKAIKIQEMKSWIGYGSYAVDYSRWFTIYGIKANGEEIALATNGSGDTWGNASSSLQTHTISSSNQAIEFIGIISRRTSGGNGWYRLWDIQITKWQEGTTTTGTTGWQDSNTTSLGTITNTNTRTVYAAPATWGSLTGWRDATAYTKTTSRKPATRTVYAAPATWGTATGWTTTGAYTKTTSRKPVTRTTYHYAG